MRKQLKLWDSKRERERKLTGLNTLLAVCRTKGLSNSREELASGGPAHLPPEAGGRGKGQTLPQRQDPYHTANRPAVSNQRLPEILDGRHLPGGSWLDTGCTHPTGMDRDWGWGCGGEKAHAPGESAPVKLLAA